MRHQPIILFDGVCNFCNGAVNFTIKRDKQKQIRFAALQSEAGRQLVQQYGLPADDMRSFLFIENKQSVQPVNCSIKSVQYLKGLWPLCYGLIVILHL
jgi:predicted DCC family thiol-disulfide oxidoreductase YuxK